MQADQVELGDVGLCFHKQVMHCRLQVVTGRLTILQGLLGCLTQCKECHPATGLQNTHPSDN